ncbi:hypothetical protein Hanom_Chr13g01205201 [Helianthus anomalus]
MSSYLTKSCMKKTTYEKSTPSFTIKKHQRYLPVQADKNKEPERSRPENVRFRKESLN